MAKSTLIKIIAHPAFLFEIGNVALAIGYAEITAVILNILLVCAIFTARWMTVVRGRPYDISFTILAAVNLFTGLSVIYKAIFLGDGLAVGSILAALTYVFWALGHLAAGYLENKKKQAQAAILNPQFHYGIGDMLVVNIQGSINLYSFPFTVAGFAKSLFVGNKKKIHQPVLRRAYEEVSSARLYAAGFFVGAISSIAVPHLVVAQVLWALAYLQFGKDNE